MSFKRTEIETYEIPATDLFRRRIFTGHDAVVYKFYTVRDMCGGDLKLTKRLAFRMMMTYREKGELHTRDAEFWRAVLHVAIRAADGVDPRDKRFKARYFRENPYQDLHGKTATERLVKSGSKAKPSRGKF